MVDVFPDDSELTGADSLRRVRIRGRENQLAVRGKALGRGGEDHVEVRYVLDQLARDDHVEWASLGQRTETVA